MTTNLQIKSQIFHIPPVIEASREVANSTERKNLHTPYIWCQRICLSVCLYINIFDYVLTFQVTFFFFFFIQYFRLFFTYPPLVAGRLPDGKSPVPKTLRNSKDCVDSDLKKPLEEYLSQPHSSKFGGRVISGYYNSFTLTSVFYILFDCWIFL